MDDHPGEHEAAAAGDVIEPADPVEPAVPETLPQGQSGATTTAGVGAGTAPSDITPDPWALFVYRQDAQAAALARRRRKRLLIASGISVVIVAAAVGGVFASHGSSAPGSGMAPADFVVSSTQTTLAQRTADVTFSGSVSAQGQNIPISGTGQVDFDTNDFSATLSENAESHTFAIQELISSGQFYMGMSIDGHDMSEMTGGAHWVGISLPDQSSSSGLGAANVDPIAQLKALEQKGATVTSLGTEVIDGTTVSGYSVTPSRQEVENEIQQEVQQNQISGVTAQQMLQAPNLIGTFTSQVWIDGSGFIRQENVNISGGSAGIDAKVTVTYQNYGTPVSISTPAPSDVIPFSQFLDDLKTLQSTQGD